MQHLPEAISTKSRSMLNSFKTCTESDICKKHFSKVQNCSIFLTHPKSSNIIFKKHFTRFRLLNSFSTPNPTSAESIFVSQRVQVAQFLTHTERVLTDATSKFTTPDCSIPSATW
jgi:hypothetical protein